jgi:uncharacterized damage-inducible protein DinB
MSEVPLWVERSFEGEPALAMHPNVRARLAYVAGRVLEATRDLPREVLTQRVDDKWSIQEHAGHLLDLEGLFGARIGEYLAGVDTLAAADMSNAKTEKARHNDAELAAIVAGLRAARGETMALVDGLGEADFERVAVHPRLGKPMRLFDFLLFVAEHDDHHVAKMRELRSRLS